VREDEREIIAFCVGGGKNGTEEMVRKMEYPMHAQWQWQATAGWGTEVDEMTKTGEKPVGELKING